MSIRWVGYCAPGHVIIPGMRISDIGEFGLVARLDEVVAGAPRPAGLVLGMGDDAAAWSSLPGITLATADCLVEGVHFTLETTGWFELGWKAMASNLSDIAAMGGRAAYALVTLGLPPQTEVEDVVAFYRGMNELARQHGVTIAGGDTSRSETLFFSLAVIGQAQGRIMERSRAAPGDAIAVTGCPGAAAAGWKLLQAGRQNEAGAQGLVQAFLKPAPRLREGQSLLEAGVRAAIDISDGLAADLEHICRCSSTGAVVKLADIPLHPRARDLFGEDAIGMALGGGEDYELLFTAGQETLAKLVENARVKYTVIGEVTSNHPGSAVFLDTAGKQYRGFERGWQHFASRQQSGHQQRRPV